MNREYEFASGLFSAQRHCGELCGYTLRFLQLNPDHQERIAEDISSLILNPIEFADLPINHTHHTFVAPDDLKNIYLYTLTHVPEWSTRAKPRLRKAQKRNCRDLDFILFGYAYPLDFSIRQNCVTRLIRLFEEPDLKVLYPELTSFINHPRRTNPAVTGQLHAFVRAIGLIQEYVRPESKVVFEKPLGRVDEKKIKTLSRTDFIKRAGLATGIAGTSLALWVSGISNRTSRPAAVKADDHILYSTFEVSPTTVSHPPVHESPKKPAVTATVNAKPTQEFTPPAKPTESVSESMNMAEFFLSDLADKFMKLRLQRIEQDPASRERIDPQLIKDQSINLLIMGLDQARWRTSEWTGYGELGYGNNDVSIILSFNPHTCACKIISFPRDLYAPEIHEWNDANGLEEGKSGIIPWRRINGVTARATLRNSNGVKQEARVSWNQQQEMARKVFESATGLPIDGMVKFNIDFATDFFARVCPDGLTVTNPKAFTQFFLIPFDEEIARPTNYRTAKIYNGQKGVLYDFPAGEITLKDDEITAFVRARKEIEGADDGRGSRQRLVSQAFMKDVFNRFLKSDVVTGSMETLNLIQIALEDERNKGNFTDSFDTVGFLTSVIKTVRELRGSPAGIAQAIALTGKSALVFSDNSFKTFAADKSIYAITGQRPSDTGLKFIKGTIPSGTLEAPPENLRTELGNYISYWKTLRDAIKQLYTTT